MPNAETDPNIIPFLFEGDGLVRAIDRDGDPWFVAADICRLIGIKQPTQAVEKLDEDEKGVLDLHTLGGTQEHLVVSESGLYTMMLRSHAAMERGTVAHRFRRWVTSELIPAIRKTGRYVSEPAATDAFPAPRSESYADKMSNVRLVMRMSGERAAFALYVSLGLPIVPEMFRDPRQMEIPLDTEGNVIIN